MAGKDSEKQLKQIIEDLRNENSRLKNQLANANRKDEVFSQHDTKGSARYEGAFDHFFYKELQRNFEQQKLLTNVSYQFTSLEHFEENINRALQLVGTHTEVSRVYIFEDSADGKYTSNTFEWCNTGIESQIENLQGIPYSTIPSWKKILKEEGHIHARDIKMLPEDIKVILEPQGILSLLVIPLEIKGGFFGFIGFDDCERARKWDDSEINLLKTVSNIISNYFEGKRAEKALVESEEKYRNLFENFQDIFYTTDLEGNITLISPSVYDLSGFTPQEMIGTNARRFYKDASDQERLLNQLFNNGEVRGFETNMIIKNGDEITVSMMAQLIYDDQGNPLETQGVLRDITEKRKAYRALKESEEHFRTFTEFAPIAIMIYSKNKWIYANKYAQDLTGYTSEEFLKMNYWDIVHPDYKQLIKERGSARLDGRNSEVENHYEFKILHKNGSEIWVDFRAEPIEYHGQIAVLISAQDITQRKKMEQDLVDAKNKAIESDRLKSAFLATMSHELRTPLNAIIGFSDLLKDGENGEELREYAETINTNGVHLLNLIQDIFDLSIIESGKINIISKTVNVHNIMDEIWDILAAELKNFKKEHLHVYTNLPEKNIEITSDPYRLKQIMLNLLKNALKFTHEGFVEYGYKQAGEHALQLYVKDSGIGVPEDKREVIFERFRQLDDSHTRKYEGTGLGLSISKELAELLGGEINVESEEGKGSIFYFTLPFQFRKITKSLKSGKSSMTANNKETNHLEGKTILIVEDDLSSYALLKTILKVNNANALWATQGSKAIELCHSNDNIDLVLMDIKLPDISGFEATRKIKEICPNIPIIAQTAYAMSGDREKALEEGCDDYISKPIKKDHLMMILQKHLSGN
ncbi:MAG: PAS domain S-box protein [Bacteroidales bacterium]|nr:PAS domain S-box protein [Bacteroidales bacterium]